MQVLTYLNLGARTPDPNLIVREAEAKATWAKTLAAGRPAGQRAGAEGFDTNELVFHRNPFREISTCRR